METAMEQVAGTVLQYQYDPMVMGVLHIRLVLFRKNDSVLISYTYTKPMHLLSSISKLTMEIQGRNYIRRPSF